MSVLQSKRKESSFEVFHKYYVLRKEITDLLLRDFGYSAEKSQIKIMKQFKGKTLEELNDAERTRYYKMVDKNTAFDEWFVINERNAITGYLRDLGMYMFTANNIFPMKQEELTQRRLYQERALGCCEMLTQELQYAIETLPVDINKYTRFAEMIDQEIKLIKAWRRADNKLKKSFKDEKLNTDDQ